MPSNLTLFHKDHFRFIFALIKIWLISCRLGYRVQGLKFHTDVMNDLNDILLRVSAFGLFIYAVFSIIAGTLSAFTEEPNLLVMITNILVVCQVHQGHVEVI